MLIKSAAERKTRKRRGQERGRNCKGEEERKCEKRRGEEGVEGMNEEEKKT